MTRDLHLCRQFGMKVIEPATLQLKDAVKFMTENPNLYYLRLSNNSGFYSQVGSQIKLPSEGDFITINKNNKSNNYLFLSSMELLSQISKL